MIMKRATPSIVITTPSEVSQYNVRKSVKTWLGSTMIRASVHNEDPSSCSALSAAILHEHTSARSAPLFQHREQASPAVTFARFNGLAEVQHENPQ